MNRRVGALSHRLSVSQRCSKKWRDGCAFQEVFTSLKNYLMAKTTPKSVKITVPWICSLKMPFCRIMAPFQEQNSQKIVDLESQGIRIVCF